jgi:hypothetical protein
VVVLALALAGDTRYDEAANPVRILEKTLELLLLDGHDRLGAVWQLFFLLYLIR